MAWYIVKLLHVVIFQSIYSIEHYSFICPQSNRSKYYYVIPIFQFRLTVKEFQELLFNTNNSSQYFSFICTQINGSKYCYVSQTIQLDIRQLNVKCANSSISSNSI